MTTPTTKAGRALFADWLVRRRDHPPNTKRALDLILAIEAEAAALRPIGLDRKKWTQLLEEEEASRAGGLDVERLARAEHNRRVSVDAECHHGRAGNDCDIVARWDAREYARLAAEEGADD